MGRPRKVRPHLAALTTIRQAPDELWSVLAPSSLRWTRPIRPGASGWARGPSSTRSSSGCAAAASGTSCPSGSPMTARCIAPSSAGCAWDSSSASGPRSCRRVRSWAAWTGSGKRQTGRWARHGWGGPHRPQSDRSGQTRSEAQPAGRGGRRSTGNRDCRRQCA